MSNAHGTCVKVCNNKYFGSPAVMNDGRTFTDYRQNCQMNEMIMKKNRKHVSGDYRRFLINNGEKLIDVNRKISEHTNSNEKCNARKEVNISNFTNTDNNYSAYNDDMNTNAGFNINEDILKKVDNVGLFNSTNIANFSAMPGEMCRSCDVEELNNKR